MAVYFHVCHTYIAGLSNIIVIVKCKLLLYVNTLVKILNAMTKNSQIHI